MKRYLSAFFLIFLSVPFDLFSSASRDFDALLLPQRVNTGIGQATFTKRQNVFGEVIKRGRAYSEPAKKRKSHKKNRRRHESGKKHHRRSHHKKHRHHRSKASKKSENKDLIDTLSGTLSKQVAKKITNVYRKQLVSPDGNLGSRHKRMTTNMLFDGLGKDFEGEEEVSFSDEPIRFDSPEIRASMDRLVICLNKGQELQPDDAQQSKRVDNSSSVYSNWTNTFDPPTFGPSTLDRNQGLAKLVAAQCSMMMLRLQEKKKSQERVGREVNKLSSEVIQAFEEKFVAVKRESKKEIENFSCELDCLLVNDDEPLLLPPDHVSVSPDVDEDSTNESDLVELEMDDDSLSSPDHVVISPDVDEDSTKGSNFIELERDNDFFSSPDHEGYARELVAITSEEGQKERLSTIKRTGSSENVLDQLGDLDEEQGALEEDLKPLFRKVLSDNPELVKALKDDETLVNEIFATQELPSVDTSVIKTEEEHSDSIAASAIKTEEKHPDSAITKLFGAFFSIFSRS